MRDHDTKQRCYGVSERRAAGAARFWRSSLRYQSRRDPLAGLRQRMRELAQTRVRFGYRRLRVLMLREGWEVGKERFYRVYTEEGLALNHEPAVTAVVSGTLVDLSPLARA